MKKPKLSELTLREKIGQTALMESALLMNVENLEDYLLQNPIGNAWHACNEGIGGGNLVSPPFDDPRDSNFYRNWAKGYEILLKIPPLMALDGPEPSIATDIPQIVSAALVGATNSEAMAYEYGKLFLFHDKGHGKVRWR